MSKVRRTPVLQERLVGMPNTEDDGSFYWYTHFMLVKKEVTLDIIRELTARHLSEKDAAYSSCCGETP